MNPQIIRSQRKTLALQINPDATLIVRAPHQLPLTKIQEILQKKRGWIERKQHAALETFRATRRIRLRAGEKLPYLGEEYPLSLISSSSPEFQFNGREFLIAQEMFEKGKVLLEKWYRAQALQIIGERVGYYATLTGWLPSNITITGARQRWGSCSNKGKLNFSWRLILAPAWVVDHVVIHEIVHLAEHNHSPQFWAKVRELDPRYREAKTWLNRHSAQFQFD